MMEKRRTVVTSIYEEDFNSEIRLSKEKRSDISSKYRYQKQNLIRWFPITYTGRLLIHILDVILPLKEHYTSRSNIRCSSFSRQTVPTSRTNFRCSFYLKKSFYIEDNHNLENIGRTRLKVILLTNLIDQVPQGILIPGSVTS